MSQVKLFPWPKEWKKTRRIVGFFGLALGGLLLVAFSHTLWKAIFITGDYREGIEAFIFLPAVFCFVLMSIHVISRRRRFARSFRSVRSTMPGETSEPGLVLKYSETIPRCFVIFTVCSILVFIRVLCDPKMRADRIFSIPNVIVAPLLICFGISFLIFASKRPFSGVLIVTGWGIYKKRCIYDLALPWEIVRDIQPRSGNPPQIWIYNHHSSDSQIDLTKHTENRFFYNGPKNLPNVILFPKNLEIDPVLALYLLRFYWIETTARSELGTPAALERLRRGDLTTQREYPPIY